MVMPVVIGSAVVTVVTLAKREWFLDVIIHGRRFIEKGSDRLTDVL